MNQIKLDDNFHIEWVEAPWNCYHLVHTGCHRYPEYCHIILGSNYCNNCRKAPAASEEVIKKFNFITKSIE